MRFIELAALCGALLGPSADAVAAPDPSASSSVPTPRPASPVNVARSHIDTMLRTGHADAAWFSATFLAQVSASKVDELIAGLETSLGPYRSVYFTPAKFIAHFAKGTDDVLIHLDADNKIDALLFHNPVMTSSTLDDGLRALRPATGTLSYVISENGRSERAALNASALLAVGSAFKLAVVNAVRDQVMLGSRHWDDIVALQGKWKSLPSGVLQNWPDGTPLTLATYAAEMISISDNTAADALAQLVGADALKKYAARNVPFLTTRQTFTLRSEQGASLRATYLAASTPVARAAILKRVDALPLPTIQQVVIAPELKIEWHYSVRELCKLLSRVADVPLMSINPGVADRAAFRNVAFKGGSDAGVINLTTVVRTLHGTNVCFSATLNDSLQQVNESAFETAYAGVLHYIAAF